ncbi:MAG TPA: hypothetical protein VF783_13825 [Terriglobales bacterium]
MAVIKDTDLGITGNGSDETAALQSAVNTTAGNGDRLLITKGIRVNANGILMPNNGYVIFDTAESAYVKLLPTTSSNYDIFMFMGNNQTLINARIDGSNETNTGGPGACSGMGIGIAGATNTTIVNPIVKNVNGDGYYIRGTYTSANTPPSNINIFNPRASGCGRNAMSVVSANGLLVTNIDAEDIFAQLPMCLIDFEPNNNVDVLLNVRVFGANSRNCQNGLRFSLQNTAGVNPQVIDILVERFKDEGCMDMAIHSTGLNAGSYSVTGSITVNGAEFFHSHTTVSQGPWSGSVPVAVNDQEVTA